MFEMGVGLFALALVLAGIANLTLSLRFTGRRAGGATFRI
jgi:hypothetical protein